MSKGIKPANARGPWRYDQPTRPTYKTKELVTPEVTRWLLQWNLWFNEVLLPELNKAFVDYNDDKKFSEAMEQIQQAGETMHGSGCMLLNWLSSTYPYANGRQPSEGKRAPVLTDSTKPPPPPFGGSL